MKSYKNIVRSNVQHNVRKDIHLTLNDPGTWNYTLEKIIVPFNGFNERYRLPISWHLLSVLRQGK